MNTYTVIVKKQVSNTSQVIHFKTNHAEGYTQDNAIKSVLTYLYKHVPNITKKDLDGNGNRVYSYRHVGESYIVNCYVNSEEE